MFIYELLLITFQNVNSKITCIQVISTVDYMVAAGNEHGVVTVFQIPKSPPDSLPDSLKPKQKKQVERYSISGLHNSTVTTVEWSKNGMKLFSGDQDGLVVLTEIDFYMVCNTNRLVAGYVQALIIFYELFDSIYQNLRNC